MFCDKHLVAPAGQRGGWLSAYKRRLAMGKTAQAQPIDASNITPRLWMGGVPPFDQDLPKVDALVLAAREHQPAGLQFHGFVYRCPLVDDHLEKAELLSAMMCAQTTAQLLLAGKTVLVTCAQGRNRAGLIAGFALGYVTRLTADEIIDLIRKRRKLGGVLANDAFCGYLRKYIDGGRKPR